MSKWQAYLDAQQDRFEGELLDFLRIPSISSLPDHAEAVQEAAGWVARRAEQAGLENVVILPTEGHPVVYADWMHAAGKPVILIYGHFDTQPVDPIALWQSPPFEPRREGDRLYARGASDDKGNMFAPLLAVEALLQTNGSLPVNVKFLLEGQEEIGSPNIPAFMANEQERFACDLAVSADGGQWAEDQPEVPLATRGLCAMQVNVTGPKVDLHSGIFGGTVQNPIHVLTTMLAALHDEDGHIAVTDFYKEVYELSDDEMNTLNAVPFDADGYQAQLGVQGLYGERGYSTHARAWVRPTLEINGIWGGFMDAGMKTVLPSQAHAKITCRLVPDQAPDVIAQRVASFLQEIAPEGVTVDVEVFANAAYPYVVPADHPGNQATHAVLEKLYGKPPYYTRTGGSVPLYQLFMDQLGVYTVTFGFGLPDENIHSPNEFWRMSSFRRAQTGYAMLLEELATRSLGTT